MRAYVWNQFVPVGHLAALGPRTSTHTFVCCLPIYNCAKLRVSVSLRRDREFDGAAPYASESLKARERKESAKISSMTAA